MHHWHGPYRIVKQLSPVNFQLRDTINRLVSTPVHVNRMKLYYGAKDRPIKPPPVNDDDDKFSLTEDELPPDSFESELANDKQAPDDHTNFNNAQSMPDTPTTQDNELDDLSDAPNEDIYEIEKILKTRKHKGEKQYLVKWLGYPSEQNSWVSESDMVPFDVTNQPAINCFSTHDFKTGKPVGSNQSKFGSVWVYLLSILFMSLVIGVSLVNGSNINLAPLYDCSKVHHTALYKFTDHAQCEHKMHLSTSKVKYFNADVLQFSPRSTHLTIHHCKAERLEMTCHDSFFGHKGKHRSLHTIPVTVEGAMSPSAHLFCAYANFIRKTPESARFFLFGLRLEVKERCYRLQYLR